MKKLVEKKSSQVDAWVQDNRRGYQKLYGPNWETEIYKDAWAKFGVKNGKKKVKTLKNESVINEGEQELAALRLAFDTLKSQLLSLKNNTSNKSVDINRKVRSVLHTDLASLERDVFAMVKEYDKRKSMGESTSDKELKESISKLKILAGIK